MDGSGSGFLKSGSAKRPGSIRIRNTDLSIIQPPGSRLLAAVMYMNAQSRTSYRSISKSFLLKGYKKGRSKISCHCIVHMLLFFPLDFITKTAHDVVLTNTTRSRTPRWLNSTGLLKFDLAVLSSHLTGMSTNVEVEIFEPKTLVSSWKGTFE